MRNVQIIGGTRSGEHIKWFGRRVYIDRQYYQLHRAYFTNGTSREYYVKQGLRLEDVLGAALVERIEEVE